MTFHSYKEPTGKRPYVKPTKFEDLIDLIRDMRDEDRAEVTASHGSPKEAVSSAFLYSKFCETIFTPDGKVAGVYGVMPYSDVAACPWMLSTVHLPKVWLSFLRGSREWVRNINKIYPVLSNCVDADYKESIQWLKFLGFTFIKRYETYGVNPKPFYEFTRIPEV